MTRAQHILRLCQSAMTVGAVKHYVALFARYTPTARVLDAGALEIRSDVEPYETRAIYADGNWSRVSFDYRPNPEPTMPTQ